MPGNKLNAHPSLGYIWGCFFCLFCFVLNAEPQTAKSQCREVMKFAQGPQLLSNSAEIWTKPVSPLMAQTPPSKQRGWVPCSSSSILPGHQTESWRLQVSLAFFFQHPECQNPGRKHGWTISQPGVYKRRREKKKEKQGSVRISDTFQSMMRSPNSVKSEAPQRSMTGGVTDTLSYRCFSSLQRLPSSLPLTLKRQGHRCTRYLIVNQILIPPTLPPQNDEVKLLLVVVSLFFPVWLDGSFQSC